MQPREQTIGWIESHIPDIIVDPDTSEFNIKCRINGGDLKILYQVEVIEEWEDEWPENWKSIYIPTESKKLLTEWKRFYKDDLYTFVIFRKDLKKAWHIAADIINDSKISGKNYLIDMRDAYQVDMTND